MDKKISVIVPVYKVERYLTKCVDSILSQTYENLDVILVDDGSPDGCPAICDEYAKNDARVRVIHKENGGLSSARNAGLAVADGDFVAFVDSDDYIAPDIYEKMLKALAECDADIATMLVQRVNESYEPVGSPTLAEDFRGVHTSEWLYDKICRRLCGASVCSKLYKSSVIADVRFVEGKLNEDFIFNSELLIKKRLKVLSVDAVGYYYYTRPASISQSGFGKSLCDAVYNTEAARLLAAEHFPQLVAAVGAYAAYQARTALLVMSGSEYKENAEFVAYCRDVIKRNKPYIKGSFMNKKERIFCSMYIALPRFTKWLFDILRRKRS